MLIEIFVLRIFVVDIITLVSLHGISTGIESRTSEQGREDWDPYS
jgi:hypothetical protein